MQLTNVLQFKLVSFVSNSLQQLQFRFPGPTENSVHLFVPIVEVDFVQLTKKKFKRTGIVSSENPELVPGT